MEAPCLPLELGYDATYLGGGLQPDASLRGKLLRGKDIDLRSQLLMQLAEVTALATLTKTKSHVEFSRDWSVRELSL